MKLNIFNATSASPDNRQLIVFSLLLAALTALIYLPLLDQPQLYNEETRRALVAESMMQSGDYWVPVIRDQVYTAKPPLYNWLIVAASGFSGAVDAFSARIASVISLGLLAIAMVWGLRRQLSTQGLVFVGLSMVLAPEFARKALSAEIESLFTLLVTLSIWCWYWLDQRGARDLRLWLPSAVLVALAFLTKREPALVFYYFAIGGYLLFNRRLKELFRWPHLLCATLTLAIIGLWLWQMIDTVGLDAFVTNTLNEVVKRGVDKSLGDYLSHIASYPLEIMLAIFPFSLLLLPLFSGEVRRQLDRRCRPLYRFCLIAILINLPIYLFRGEVSVRYFMPMMPTMLVLAALVYEVLMTESATSNWLKSVARLVSVLTVALAATVMLLLFPEQLGLADKPVDLLPTPLVYLIAIGFIAASLLLLRPAWRHGRRYALVTLVVLGLGFRALYFDVLLPHKSADLKVEEDYAGLVSQVYATIPDQALPVRTYGWVPHAFWYYMDYGDVATLEKGGLSVPDGFFVAMRAEIQQLQADGLAVDEIAFIPLKIGDLVFARAKP